MAETADALAHHVCETLDVELTPPFVIHHYFDSDQSAVLVERTNGRITDRWILIGEFLLRHRPRFAVAHELVHWYESSPWNRLPHVVEEGLADYIGLDCDPGFRVTRRALMEKRFAEMTPDRRARAIAVTNRTYARASEEVKLDMYAVGFEIVQRLGIERLRELCERAEREGLAEAPIEWFDDITGPPSNGEH